MWGGARLPFPLALTVHCMRAVRICSNYNRGKPVLSEINLGAMIDPKLRIEGFLSRPYLSGAVGSFYPGAASAARKASPLESPAACRPVIAVPVRLVDRHEEVAG